MSWHGALVWPEICSYAQEHETAQEAAAEGLRLPHNWVVWRAQIEGHLEQHLRTAGAWPLPSFCTEGVASERIEWFSPGQVQEGVAALRRVVEHNQDPCREVLELYGDFSGRGLSARELFLQDLDAIAALARRAADLGHKLVTLELDY